MPTTLFGYDTFTAARAGDESRLFSMLEDARLDDFERRTVYNEALDGAARGGHYEIVERILQYPNIDYRCYRDQAIIGAIVEGHTEIFKLFLADPRVKAVSLAHAYWWASRKQNVEIMELLRADGRGTAAVECPTCGRSD